MVIFFVSLCIIQDRLTIQERDQEEARERAAERAAEVAAAERRKESRRLVETIVKNDYKDKKTKDTDPLGKQRKKVYVKKT